MQKIKFEIVHHFWMAIVQSSFSLPMAMLQLWSKSLRINGDTHGYMLFHLHKHCTHTSKENGVSAEKYT